MRGLGDATSQKPVAPGAAEAIPGAYRITWLAPDGTEHSLVLEGTGHVTVGRRGDNDVAVPWDAGVSRVHAQLTRVGSEWTVRDDGLSRNGTWVNGDRVRGSRRLSDGDVMRVGRTILVVHTGAHRESEMTAAGTATDGLEARGSPSIAVTLCGTLTLTIAGQQRESELSGGKGRRLFAYLVMHRDHAVRRDELTEILWPRARPASPEGALNVHLTRLRTLLGKAAVAGRTEVTLDLGTDAAVDVEQAGRLMREAQRARREEPVAAVSAARTALRILRCELLPEFDDLWVRDERIRLEGWIPDLLEIEAEVALKLGGDQLPAAETAARALLDHRPYRESDYRLLMRAHAARGNPAEALLVYERLRQRLIADLGVPPTLETRALYEELLDTT